MRKFLSFITIFLLFALLPACGGVKLSFVDEEIIISVGDEKTLEVKMSDKSAVLEWSSSDETVVAVSQDGKITGKEIGNADITVEVKDKDISATLKVTVEAFAGTVSFETASIDILVGTSTKLTLVISPSVSLALTWASDNKAVAEVDESGKVSAKAVGTANVSVSGGGKSANIKINVIQPTPASLVIVGAESLHKSGTEVQLKANVAPALASQEVEWSSSDDEVATVSAEGLVSFVGMGNVTITATSKVKSSIANFVAILVTEPDPASIIIKTATDEPKVPLYGEIQLTAEVLPAGAQQSVAWGVSDPTLALITEDGVLYGFTEGTVTVTATSYVDDDVYAALEITIYRPDPAIITVSGELSILAVDEELQLQTVVTPESANQSVIFESSDPSIATVDENGKVTAIGVGTVTITVKSQVKEDVSATYAIEIVGKFEEDVDYSLILVDANLDADRFSKVVVDSHEYYMGITAFSDLAAAFNQIKEGSTVLIKAGTYTDDVEITKNDVTILGPNSDVNPVTNLEDRGPEAEMKLRISIGVVKNLVIKGLKFLEKGQIYSENPYLGLTLENLYFVNPSLSRGQGVVYCFTESDDHIVENISVKNCFFKDTDSGSTRGIRFNNIKNLDVEGCYFYGYVESIRLQGTNNTGWTSSAGKGPGAQGVLNIKNNRIENSWQYPIIIAHYQTTELNITDNYVGVSTTSTTAYGFIALSDNMVTDHQIVVNILRNEFPYQPSKDDNELRLYGKASDNITYNVNYNIWHEKPNGTGHHVLNHTAGGVTINAKYNVYLYDGEPLASYFSLATYEPYFKSIEELEDFLKNPQ